MAANLANPKLSLVLGWSMMSSVKQASRAVVLQFRRSLLSTLAKEPEKTAVTGIDPQ